jgi:hypothetical protein
MKLPYVPLHVTLTRHCVQGRSPSPRVILVSNNEPYVTLSEVTVHRTFLALHASHAPRRRVTSGRLFPLVLLVMLGAKAWFNVEQEKPW